MKVKFFGRDVSIYVVLAAFLGVAIIITAVTLEVMSSGNDTDGGRDNSGNGGSLSDSNCPVQNDINSLDWIEQNFLTINRYSRPGISLETVNGVVIHNIGNPGTTALQNRNYFQNLAETGRRFASAHFIIDIDGGILQCVPVDEIAYASNERNYDTISIELCHPDDTGEFSTETYNSAVRLTAWILNRYGLSPGDLLRHSDIIATDCPRYFTNVQGTWERFKEAVGAEMERQR